MPKNIAGLEFLRGACALLVMIYHCLLFAGVGQLTAWGYYGVYIFFVISGAVLYYNYHDMRLTVPQFLLKRFARLVPLYAACLLVPAMLAWQWNPVPQLLNVSMLFGFTNPGGTSKITGGWSLGIEFALYALFPTLLGFTTSRKLAIGALVVLFLLRFAFVDIEVTRPMFNTEGWVSYIQPGAFMCFFFAGMLIAKYRWATRPMVMTGIAVVCAIALFGAAPMGTEADVLTGLRGAACSMLSVIIVAACFFSPQSTLMLAISRFLGDISYGVYLLHPIVWSVLGKLQVELYPRIAATIVLTSALAWLSLRLYERPARQLIVRLSG
jgi:exopolysaccharide production protein ExoZ